jgi:hypothetical protein
VRADGDFEDREGHQAPFTLRKGGIWKPENQKREEERQFPKAALMPFLAFWLPNFFPLAARLFDLRNERVEVRPFAGRELGVEQFSIGADFEGAAARRHERERRDPIAEFENLSRQTDGFGRVVSNAAILDPDFGFHRSLLSKGEAIGQKNRGQVRADLAP